MTSMARMSFVGVKVVDLGDLCGQKALELIDEWRLEKNFALTESRPGRRGRFVTDTTVWCRGKGFGCRPLTP